MTSEVRTADGHKVAVEGLVLFFNNETITYGYEALQQGMTKDEAKQALEARGFEPVLAEAFLKKMHDNVNLFWEAGRLSLPSQVVKEREEAA